MEGSKRGGVRERIRPGISSLKQAHIQTSFRKMARSLKTNGVSCSVRYLNWIYQVNIQFKPLSGACQVWTHARCLFTPGTCCVLKVITVQVGRQSYRQLPRIQAIGPHGAYSNLFCSQAALAQNASSITQYQYDLGTTIWQLQALVVLSAKGE